MLSDWIVANKKDHPNKVVGSIFKLNKDKQIVARILDIKNFGAFSTWSKDSSLPDIYFLGFVCGTNYFGSLSQSYGDSCWEIKDESLKMVAIKVDLRLLSMNYKIKSIGKFEESK